MDSYGRAGFKPFINVEALGPPIGKTMTCTNCHTKMNDDNYEFNHRGSLNSLLSISQLFGKMTAKGNFAMPPSADNPELKPYFYAIQMADHLSDQDKKLVSASTFLSPDGGGGQMIQLETDRANENSNADDIAYQIKVFDLMVQKGLLSQGQRDDAVDILRRHDKEMQLAYSKMIQGYAHELQRWLMGGSDQCVISGDQK